LKPGITSATLGQYCFSNVGPTTTVDTNLGPVSLIGKSKTITEYSNCPGAIGPIDATEMIADVIPGFNYTLNYQVITCGSAFNVVSGAWIDYNGNYQFDDWEVIGFTTLMGNISFNFTAVNTSEVAYGLTRLRVQVQETSQTLINPCASFPYGGTKDFTIEIVEEFPGYCNSGPTTTMDTELGMVSLRGENRNILENTGCPGNTGPVNFTNLTADVIIGNKYTLNYTIITCSNEYPATSSAWVDWNQNNIWDIWEQIIPMSVVYDNQFHVFKVPKSTPEEVVKPGITRMRVQVQETSAPLIYPCALFAFGGTKDFSIEVKPTVDGGWTGWSSCNATCGGGWQTRACSNPPPSEEGQNCTGANVGPCNTQSCGASKSTGGKVAAGILVPLIVIGGLVGFYIYRKKKREEGGDFATDHSTEPTAGGTSAYQQAV